MSDVKLGTLASSEAERDAIHVAVAPVVAAERLSPGMHVKLTEDGTAQEAICHKGIGIVDPFLTKAVKAGERFWLCLYQNTVVGMRHHWAHPAFSSAAPAESRAPVSEAWLRDFAMRNYDGDYPAMMEDARKGNLCFGSEDYPEYESDAFWAHFNAATGSTINNGYFRCAC